MSDVGQERVWAAELSRRGALLEAAERLAGIGSWEWIPDTGELIWSDNLFRILGLEPGEIEPSLEYILKRTHPEDRERAVVETERVQRGTVSQRFEYRIVMTDGTVRHLRSMLVTVERGDGPRRIVGTIQDVTEARATRRRLAAHVAVTDALVDWQSVDQSMEPLLSALCEAMDLEIGIVWLPLGDVLVCRAYWQVETVDDREFERMTRALRYPRGVGLPGTIWAEMEPIGVASLTQETNPPRREAASQAGMLGAVGFPARHAEDALAVFEFYSAEQQELTARLSRALTGIGYELGEFLTHRRGEFQPSPLTHRELEVLQLVARGDSGREIARELDISPATVKTHLAHIYAKLGVTHRAGAVAMALREGLIK